MDCLGWDLEEDSFLISNSNSSIYGDHKMNLPQDIFINPIQQLQESQPSDHLNSDSNTVAEMVNPQPIPVSDFNMLWCSSPLLNSSASVSDIRKAVHSQVLINGGATTSSLESVDCLLSATNSNTDHNTSVEDDDGISTIFSDCKNLWNNFVATSSGESENNNGHDTESSKSGSSKRGINDEFKVGLNRGYFTESSGFKLINPEINPPKAKRPRSEKAVPSSSNINFQQPSSSSVSSSIDEPDPEAIAQMKEMIYRAAAFRPVNLGMEPAERPKRKNVRISTDPQTVAARQRRERISERIRVLQRLVPGGNKMDTASMLDEAANYLKFLRSQVKALENLGHPMSHFTSLPLNQSFPMQTHNFLLLNPNHIHHP